MATESQITSGNDDHPPEEQTPDVEQSFIDQLRARRTAIAAETTKQFSIPGYDDLLKVTYRRLGYEELVGIIRRATKTGKERDEVNAQADFLIRSCVSIDAVDGTHISDGYNAVLAEFFGLEAQRARECLFYVFGNDLAVMAHQTAVLRWMQSGASEMEEEFLGE